MVKVYKLALIGFGIGMVELSKNCHNFFCKSENKVKCPLACTTCLYNIFVDNKYY